MKDKLHLIIIIMLVFGCSSNPSLKTKERWEKEDMKRLLTACEDYYDSQARIKINSLNINKSIIQNDSQWHKYLIKDSIRIAESNKHFLNKCENIKKSQSRFFYNWFRY